MTGKADVGAHLNVRRPTIDALFADWSRSDLTSADRVNVVESYFKDAEVGDLQRLGNSVHVSQARIDGKRPHVMVVGRHDIGDLSQAAPHRATDGSVVGPGIASRLGPTIAFCEGFQAARSLTVENPVNLTCVSLGEGDTFPQIAASIFTGNLDAVYLTDAVSWSPHHPAVTVGSRGRLLADLRLDAGQANDDFVTAGALRNPLSKMTQILGTIRNSRGQIDLPGFYDRALAPNAGIREALTTDGHDPDDWSGSLGAARFETGLSTLERATLWPGVSLLALDATPSDGSRMPASVTATIALYLVPDQRHVEIERALREWFVDQAPAALQPSVKVLASSRPLRSHVDSLPVAAQTRAAFQLHGRQPVHVWAGGPPGAGELAFAVGAPVGFAGIARPSTSWGSNGETLSWSDFDAGVALAAETCLQLRRA